MAGVEEPGGIDARGHGITRTGGRELLLSDTDLRNDKQAAQFMESHYGEGRRTRSTLERNWHQNIQFYQGNQWIAWDQNLSQWRTRSALEQRVRYKANLVSSYVMTRASKLLRDKPFLVVNPATGEPEDIEIAQGSTRILRYIWDYLKVQGEALPDFIIDLLLFGTGCLKVYYDPAAGPRMAFDAKDADLADTELEDGKVFSHAIGEVAVESVSPYYLYPDPSADSWKDIRWVMDARRLSLDEIRYQYPEKGRQVQDVGEPNQPEYFRDLIRGYSGSQRDSYNALERPVPAAVLKELWVKPNHQYPKGYHVISSGNVILKSEELPEWTGGEIPYYFLVDRKVPQRIWGSALTDDLRDINKTRNRHVSQIIENANLVGNPIIRNPTGSRVKGTDFQGKPGVIWQYMPTAGGHKPEFVTPPTLPNYVQDLPDRLEQDGHIVTGMNEPTMRASAPTNVRTASGLAALLKTDDSRQAVSVQMFSSCLSLVGSAVLRVVASEYKEERIAKIVGEKDQVFVFRFKGEDIEGDNAGIPGANYYDVEIRVDTGHRSKEATQQFLLQAAQLGLINLADDEERRKLLRMLDVGAADDAVFGEISIPEAQPRQENAWMSSLSDEDYQVRVESGVMVPHEWDDHDVHVRTHREYMQRVEFLRLPPERWIRFQDHVAHHQTLIQQQMVEQQLQAMAGGGGNGAQPPGPGLPGSGQSSPRGVQSLSGQPEEPNLPEPPNVEHTQFAGLV